MNKFIIILIVLVLAIIGGYFLLKGNVYAPVQNNVPQPNEKIETTSEINETTAQSKEVIYANSGYSPAEIKIKAGDTVIFKNESSNGMWTASGMHPEHTLYSGTSLQEHCNDSINNSFDECKSAQPGESWSFVFDKKGTWPYHNHVAPIHFGKIIVE